MGGLVIKRAFLLAKSKQEFEPLAQRVQAMFFLATPHRGAEMASTLSKVSRFLSPLNLVWDVLHKGHLPRFNAYPRLAILTPKSTTAPASQRIKQTLCKRPASQFAGYSINQ